MRIHSTAGSTPVDLETYDSHGSGQTVFLVHGWPLSADSWRGQIKALEDAGYRVIAHDRRGFGKSNQPGNGYNYDVMSGDVHEVIEYLHLTDVVLVGFSMGGGEVARYARQFGTEKLSGVVFASAVPPYLMKTDDNPEGVLGDADIEGMKEQLNADRDGFFAEFARNFYTADGELTVGEDVLKNWRELAAPCSTRAAVGCIDAFARTDFRVGLSRIDVPTLVIHGDSDGIVPFAASGKRTAELIANSQLVTIEGGPHGILDSHTDAVNTALLEFLGSLGS